MKIGLLSVGVIGLLIGFTFLFGGKESVTNYPPQNDRVIAFGDSLVEGVGSTEGNDFVSIVSEKIGRPIKNYGVSGNTTADGVARAPEVAKERAGTVLILLGGNDAIRRISEEVTRENLKTIIETFQKEGSVVMLLGVRGGIIGGNRADMYEELSVEYGTLYISDVLSGILLKPELMHDGIHPNDPGYAIIAERVSALFKKYKL